MKNLILFILLFAQLAQGAVVFSFRGNQADAYRSRAGKTFAVNSLDSQIPAIAADASAISGSALDMKTPQSNRNCVVFPGFENYANTKAFTFLFRVKAPNTGTPAGTGSFLFANTLGTQKSLRFAIQSNGIAFVTFPKGGGVGSNHFSASIGTATSTTANNWHDYVFTTTGLNASSLEFFFDNVSKGTLTWSEDNSQTQIYFPEIQIGSDPFTNKGLGDIGEIVIWDELIDPNSVLLEDPDTAATSTGALNGNSRTKWVAVSGINDLDFIVPAVTDVRLSTGYTSAGVAVTGTLDLAGAADLRLAVTQDNGAVVGLLNLPATTDVRLAVSFDNGTKSGTIVVPTTAQVQVGVTFDNGSVGTLDTISIQTLILSGANRTLTLEGN